MIAGNCLKIALFAAVALVARPIAAQEVSGYGAIDGAVVDTSGVGIPSVEVVLLDDPNHSVRTNSAGAYRFDRVRAGPHLIRFRRIGVVPTTASITVTANQITSADAILGIISTQLSTVRVQASNGEVFDLPPEVAGRLKNCMGTCLSMADIERRNPIQLVDVFRGVAGLSVVTYGAETYVLNLRGASSVNGCATGMRTYLDGMPLDGPGGRLAGGASALSMITPQEIVAIEIYKDAAEVPVTLSQSGCGAILLWTKHR